METATTNNQGEKHKLESAGEKQRAKEELKVKKAKVDNIENSEKHAVTTEPAPWVSSDVTLSASQYITDFLKSTPALSIIKERGVDNVFVVKSNQHAAQALSLMSKENLLSCPVYDKELEANVGFVDYMDLTSLVVGVIHKVMKDEFADIDSVGQLDSEQRHHLILHTKEAFNAKTLFDITDLSKLDPYNAVPKGSTLFHCIELLAKSGIHRVPIENAEQKIEAILSQSAVIDYLFENLDKFPSKAKEPVADIIGTEKQVLTIKEDEVAFLAFEKMIQHKVTAIGIVDESGKLVGVISSTDLRMIGPHAHTVGALLHPTKEFYEKSRDLNKWTVLPVVTTSYDETLGIVIEKMQDNFVHRVFVVDENEKPIAVISMKDVLLQFLK